MLLSSLESKKVYTYTEQIGQSYHRTDKSILRTMSVSFFAEVDYCMVPTEKKENSISLCISWFPLTDSPVTGAIWVREKYRTITQT